MRLMDIMLALPSLLLAVAVVAILGPGLANAMYAIAIVMLPHFVRLTRAAVIGELAKDYVNASRIAGAGTARLMFDTVLPNCAAPLIVQATLGFSTAILDAAALGFLGLGAQPPTPEWGSMLASALEFIQSAWWVVTLARPRDPGLGARLQPDGRRPARCARPAPEALRRRWSHARSAMQNESPTSRRARPRPLLEVAQPERRVRQRRRAVPRGRRHRPDPARRRGARHRRRIRLRQERDRARADGPGRRAGPRARGPDGVRRPRPADDAAGRAARACSAATSR